MSGPKCVSDHNNHESRVQHSRQRVLSSANHKAKKQEKDLYISAARLSFFFRFSSPGLVACPRECAMTPFVFFVNAFLASPAHNMPLSAVRGLHISHASGIFLWVFSCSCSSHAD